MGGALEAIQQAITQLQGTKDFLDEHARSGCPNTEDMLVVETARLKSTQYSIFLELQGFRFDPLVCEEGKKYYAKFKYVRDYTSQERNAFDGCQNMDDKGNIYSSN